VFEFALTNTSALTELDPGQFANAIITEFQFNLPDGFTADYSASEVVAPIGVRFAQGDGNPVLATDIERLLNWAFGAGSGGGVVARDHEATESKNDNAIFSANALDLNSVPVEDYAAGFLNEGKSGWDGAVFDTILFRVKAVGDRAITEDDLYFYGCDNLTLKFQGGGGSGWVSNHCTQVPEPSTWFMLLAAAPAGVVALRSRFRK
jgi:hypothetical protein